jgi:hypothetical protein
MNARNRNIPINANFVNVMRELKRNYENKISRESEIIDTLEGIAFKISGRSYNESNQYRNLRADEFEALNEFFDYMLKQCPQNPRLHVTYAVYHGRIKHAERARRLFERCENKFPGYFPCYEKHINLLNYLIKKAGTEQAKIELKDELASVVKRHNYQTKLRNDQIKAVQRPVNPNIYQGKLLKEKNIFKLFGEINHNLKFCDIFVQVEKESSRKVISSSLFSLPAGFALFAPRAVVDVVKSLDLTAMDEPNITFKDVLLSSQKSTPGHGI